MKTIKLIVLCLSLFLVSHSTFAQLSEKQITFNEKLAKYNDLVQKHKEKVQILQVIDNRIASSSLSVQQKNDLIAQRDIRYKNILKLEQNIQELDSTLKVLKYQIDIEKGLKEKLGGISIQNEKQIYKLTEDLYARKISVDEYWRRIERLLFDISNRQSAYNYAYDFFENKSNEISNNTKGYDSKIANYDSEMTNIKERLYSKVYKKTKLEIEINNMQKDPNFSNEIDKIYYEETGRYLPESTREEIQDTYNAAADIYAKLASEKEKLVSKKENAKNQYSYNQDVLKKLRSLCPECK